jgi:undecaprenyl-diphosphatase
MASSRVMDLPGGGAVRRGRDHRALHLGRLLTRLGRQELGLLLSLLLVASAIWAFVTLANAMVEGETQAFDRAVLQAMRTPGNPAEPWGPRWLTEVVRDYTALGSVGLLTFMTMAVVGFLLLEGKPRVTMMVVITVGAGCS